MYRKSPVFCNKLNSFEITNQSHITKWPQLLKIAYFLKDTIYTNNSSNAYISYVYGHDFGSSQSLNQINQSNEAEIANKEEETKQYVNETNIRIYPTIFEDKLYTDINSNNIQDYNVRMFNSFGVLVKNISFTSEIGETNIVIDNLIGLAEGLYYIEIVNDSGEKWSNKVMKMKK